MKLNNYIATFYTNYGTLKFKSKCNNKGIKAKPMPVPRELSSSCGTCILYESNEALILEENIEDIEACYQVIDDTYKLLKKWD